MREAMRHFSEVVSREEVNSLILASLGYLGGWVVVMQIVVAPAVLAIAMADTMSLVLA